MAGSLAEKRITCPNSTAHYSGRRRLETRPKIQRSVIYMQWRELRVAIGHVSGTLIEPAGAVETVKDPHVALVVLGITKVVLGSNRLHTHHRVAFPSHPVTIVAKAGIADLLLFSPDRERIADAQQVALTPRSELQIIPKHLGRDF